MKKILTKAIKTNTISKKDLGDLINYVNQPENQDDYYLTNQAKEDRIGKYHELFINPNDKASMKKVKLYELEDDRDLVAFRLQYYDILRDESTSFLKKSMLLYTLQKRIEYIYNKELKIDDRTGEFKELKNLLDKVKNARSYYAFKVFLNDNTSERKMKTSQSSGIKTTKKKK